MKKTTKKLPYSKYMFILFFLAIVVIAILIVKPFLSTLIVSAIVVYVFYPVYQYFCRLTKLKRLSAAILIILILLIAAIPLIIVTSKLSMESYSAYVKVKQVFLDTETFEQKCMADGGVICGFYSFFIDISERYDLNLGFHLAQGFSSFASKIISKASDFILNIPKLLLHIFIALFAMYYMFVEGKDMLAALKKALPLRGEDSERIMKNFDELIFATIHGAIVIAILQGILAGIGYFIFGITSPILLTMLTIIASFIPFLGAALVWLPVSISMLINGIITSNNSLMLRAGGLMLYGALVVSTIDNFLRPKIVGKRARVHPLVILLGVFGGLALFGFVGIIVGPFLLTLFIASLRIYEQEKEHFV